MRSGRLGRWARLCTAILLLGAVMVQAEFSLCKFNFGVDWSQHIAKNCSYYRPNCGDLSELQIPAGVDFIASFIGWTQDGATKVAPAPRADKEGLMLADAKALSATPVWYSYIIAEGAKLSKNLTDCNMGGGSGTLCTQGANYIRANRATIISQYSTYAQYAALKWGTTKPMIWALEPDFVQYTDDSQNGGGLSYADAKLLLSDIADAITAKMPNAWISMDISPWKDQSTWINGAVPLSKFKFMNTSGGVSLPGATIKDKTNWSTVWAITQKGMIADDGYGTGGTATSPNPGWSDVSNLNARINDGVVALMEAVPGAQWGNTISSLRPKLNELKTCDDAATTYTLNLTAGTGGTVAASPNAASYAANAVVTVTATPSTGYKFAGWTGDATGTTNPLSVTMTAAKRITATFSPVSTKPQYTLTVKTTGNGTVTRTPDQATYDSGATVQLVAVPGATASFLGWSGGVTGMATSASIKLLSNQTVTAAFSGVPGGDTIGELIKNGKFTDGTTSWGLGLNGGTATGAVVNGQYVTTTSAAGTAHWHIQMTQGDIKLEAGKTYTFSFEAAADAPRAIVANVGQSGGAYTSYIGIENWTLDLTSTMKKFSKTFTMTTSDQTARVEFNSGNAGTATWRLDNVSLKEGSGTDPVGQRLARPTLERSLLVAGSKQWKLQLENSLNIEFSVFDPHGRRVATWAAGRLPAGESSIAMPAKLLSVQPGLYLVEARGEGFQARSTWSKMD